MSIIYHLTKCIIIWNGFVANFLNFKGPGPSPGTNLVFKIMHDFIVEYGDRKQ